MNDKEHRNLERAGKADTDRILTIPNVLSFFRLALIPVIIVLYAKNEVWWAFGMLVLSGVTDVVDGWVARTYHMVSNFGKAIDPVADKLTQIAVLLCLMPMKCWWVVGIASSCLTLNGWFGKSEISAGFSVTTFSSCASARLSSVENKSSNGVIPKSLVFALNLQRLLGQRVIGGGNLAVLVVGKNALSSAAGFCGSDGKGDLRSEHTDFLAVVGAQRCNDLLGFVGAAIHHREQDAVDFQLRVDLPLDLCDGLHQQVQTFGREK